MDVAGKKTRTVTISLALVALLIIGASLATSTWQILSKQNKAEEQHLFLSTKAITLAVEQLFLVDKELLTVKNINSSSPLSLLITQMKSEAGILFVGIIDKDDSFIVFSEDGIDSVSFSKSIKGQLIDKGEWFGYLLAGDKSAYIYAKKIDFEADAELKSTISSSNTYIFLAVDSETLLSVYKDFRQNAMLQTLYILLAALVTWGLFLAFLSRKEQVKKAIIFEKLQTALFDTLPDGLLTIDSNNKNDIIRSANPAALRLLNAKAEDILGKSTKSLPLELYHTLENGETCVEGCWRYLELYGNFLEVLVLAFNEESISEYMILLRDRTQIRALEQDLMQLEKLAVAGRLATSIAHEVRNPLSALRGFAQYFLKKLAGKEPEEMYAKTMVQEADRLNRVVTGLLFLGRPQQFVFSEVSISKIITEIITLLKFDLEKVNCSVDMELQSSIVWADEDAFKQLILNLFLNSIEAMEQENDENKKYLITVSAKDSLKGIEVVIKDNGPGLDAEDQDKIFEPFYTNKTGGTGLGLSLVSKVMVEHLGKAEVDLSVIKGFAIKLTFPYKTS